jgi:hypothetical protein
MNQTSEELAEQLKGRLWNETGIDNETLQEIQPFILSAIQSATQPLQARIDELLLQQAQNEIAWAGITAENAELRKVIGICHSDAHYIKSEYMRERGYSVVADVIDNIRKHTDSIVNASRQAIDQSRNHST